MKSIICLFSIANEYEQPSNNLVAWFKKKPTIEELFKQFNVDLKDGDTVTKIVSLWNGNEVQIGSTHYRFEEVSEGFLS